MARVVSNSVSMVLILLKVKKDKFGVAAYGVPFNVARPLDRSG